MSFWIGAHFSGQGGLERAVQRGAALQATAFAFFVKNQRSWQSPKLEVATIEAFRHQAFEVLKLTPAAFLPHAGYLINLANPEATAQHRSLASLCDEMERCRLLGLTQLNLHPGSSLGKFSESQALRQVSEHLTTALEKVMGVDIVLENTAGQGHQLGSKWSDLATILANIPAPFRSRVGVCIDTCHAFAAGYPLHTEAGWHQTFEAFSEQVGWKALKGLHLNDSKGGLGSHLDRHANLGEGAIGLGCFERIMRSTHFKGLPLILETPNTELWGQELTWLRHQSKLR